GDSLDRRGRGSRLGVSRIGFGSRLGRLDGDLGAVGEAIGALGDDALAGLEAAQDLHAAVGADAGGDVGFVGLVVGADDHDRSAAAGIGEQRGERHRKRVGDGALEDGDRGGGRGTIKQNEVGGLDPDFEGGAARIGGGADDADGGGGGPILAGGGDGRLIADFEAGHLLGAELGAGDHMGKIHDRHQRRGGRGELAGIGGTVGDHSSDGALDFGVAELGGGGGGVGLGGGQIGGRGFERLRVAAGLERLQTLLGEGEGVVGVGGIHVGLIEVVLGDGALSVELLAVLVDGVGVGGGLLGGGEVELGLLQVGGNGAGGGLGVRRLRRLQL